MLTTYGKKVKVKASHTR